MVLYNYIGNWIGGDLVKEDKEKDKISGKDILALIIAQYSLVVPWVLIGGLIFGGLLWFIVNVLMK